VEVPTAPTFDLWKAGAGREGVRVVSGAETGARFSSDVGDRSGSSRNKASIEVDILDSIGWLP